MSLQFCCLIGRLPNLSPLYSLVLSWRQGEWQRMKEHNSKKKLPLFSGASDSLVPMRCDVYVRTPGALQLLDHIRVLWLKSVFQSCVHFCYGNSPKDMAWGLSWAVTSCFFSRCIYKHFRMTVDLRVMHRRKTVVQGDSETGKTNSSSVAFPRCTFSGSQA